MRDIKKSPPQFSRRKFLQIIAVCGAAGGLYAVGGKITKTDNVIVRESRSMMGTQINLIVCGPDHEQCSQAVESTFNKMQQLELVLSRHHNDSELNQLNQLGFIKNPSQPLHTVITLADQMSRTTDGAFDATVLPLLRLYEEFTSPVQHQVQKTLELVGHSAVSILPGEIRFTKPGMAVTLDGIGKGYIVDQGVNSLKEAGFNNVYVEAGGDLMVTGTKPQKTPWSIGIRNPRPERPDQMMVMRVTSEVAIATSGDYMQFFSDDMLHHHILDPRTGMSPPELASATVLAPSVTLADSLATAAMVMGPEKSMEVLSTMDGCEGLFIGKDLKRYKTSGFAV